MMQRFKQLFTIGFILYFFGISLGLSLNLHYCGGEVARISLYANDVDCCGSQTSSSCGFHSVNNSNQPACHLEESASCCSDISVYVHFESMPILSQYSFGLFPGEIISEIESLPHDEEGYTELNVLPNEVTEKPPSPQPSYILFNQLLVYA